MLVILEGVLEIRFSQKSFNSSWGPLEMFSSETEPIFTLSLEFKVKCSSLEGAAEEVFACATGCTKWLPGKNYSSEQLGMRECRLFQRSSKRWSNTGLLSEGMAGPNGPSSVGGRKHAEPH